MIYTTRVQITLHSRLQKIQKYGFVYSYSVNYKLSDYFILCSLECKQYHIFRYCILVVYMIDYI